MGTESVSSYTRVFTSYNPNPDSNLKGIQCNYHSNTNGKNMSPSLSVPQESAGIQ